MNKKELENLLTTLVAEVESRKKTGAYSVDAEALIVIFQILTALTGHLLSKTKK